jgi:hypothetical protein
MSCSRFQAKRRHYKSMNSRFTSNVVLSFSREKTTLQIYILKQQMVCSRSDIVDEYIQLPNVVFSFSR